MKRIIYILIFIGVNFNALAQLDRTKVPEPGPAPKINLGEYESFELKNGLKVFVVENNKLPRVAFSLSLDLDPLLEGDKAGYLSMTGQLMRTGTTSRNKAQLDQEVDFIGASLSTSSGGIFASSLTKHKDQLLDLMTDVLYNPAFPEEELEKLRKQTLSNLAANKESSDAIAGNVRNALVYGKSHPYGELTTEETVENIKVEDCKNYYKTYFKPNIAYLAIVGDIKVKEAKKLVNKYFGKWEQGDVKQDNYKMPEQPKTTQVALVDKSSAVQSVINVTYPIDLKPGSSDIAKARVLNQILGGGFSSRLMQNLREDKAYTYGARSSLSSDRLAGNFTASASVRNEVTDSAVHEFMYELKKIVKEQVTEDELKAAKAFISGSFARSLESPQTVASFALNTARYNLDKDYYANYLKNIEAVTIEDVRATAEKYIRPENAYILVVGKADDVADKMKRFGELKYYDIYGENYTPSTAADIPEGLTAQKVIESYIQAIGGVEKLKGVKDMKTVSTASIQGQQLEIVSVKQSPSKSFMTIKMGGAFEITKVIYDGKSYVRYLQGQKLPVTEKDIQDAKLEAIPFAELEYESMGVKFELKGIEKVDGQDAYALEIVFPSGTKVTEFYDATSGLKVRRVSIVDGPQGQVTQAVDYKDYQEVEGIKIPHTVIIPAGGGLKLEAKVSLIEVNSGIAESTFAIE